MLSEHFLVARILSRYRVPVQGNILAGAGSAGLLTGVGTLSQTLAALTVTATGALAIVGTLSQTLAALTVTATGVQADMTVNLLQTFTDSTDSQTSYTTASYSPAANRGLIAWVVETSVATAAGPTSVTGNGLTWVNVAGASSTTTTVSITCWVTQTGASAPSAGGLTANFAAGDLATSCMIIVNEYAGVDLSGTNGSAIYRAANVTAGNAASSTGQTITLGAFASTRNAHVYCLTHGAQEGTTPGTGFTETGDTQTGGPNRGVEAGFVLNDTTADPSWTTSSPSRWGALELVAA